MVPVQFGHKPGAALTGADVVASSLGLCDGDTFLMGGRQIIQPGTSWRIGTGVCEDEDPPFILSVKAGHIPVAHLRDLRGVVEREKAQTGVLLCFEESTKPMRAEAAGAGFYDSPVWRKK